MCKACVDAVREFFPDCPEGGATSFLMSATCFPFGGADDVRRQLKKHREAGCATYQEAEARADAEMERAMKGSA